MIQSAMIEFSKHRFHFVIDLPQDYEVYDFTQGYDPDRPLRTPFGIGKYNEKRKAMYTTELFSASSSRSSPESSSGSSSGPRDVHVGLDIAAPVATPVHVFADGEIHLFTYNGAPGDYGYTVITRHVLDGIPLYALYGHLNARSVESKQEGQIVKAGEVIAWVGDRHENGGWNPHLHFQLSYERPSVCDMPGVVTESDREAALRTYPDPRLVLGPLY